MREKRISLLLKTAIVTITLLCGAFLVPGTIGRAAEGEAAFETQKAVKLHQDGVFTVSKNDITLREDEKAKGVMISGNAEAFSDAVFHYGDSFNFKQKLPDYLMVDALAERKKKVSLAFYLDDEEKPFTTINLAKQKKAEVWSTVKNRCINLSKERLNGSHKLSFKVVTSEKGSLKLAFRSVTFMKSDIPTVEFDLDESEGTIAEMNGDSKHDTECYGNVTISIPLGYQSEYTKKECETQTYELDYVRGRGNSTWMADKKPYKFKLDKKQDLLGMGANKHWILLANYYDITMLRNKITYWLGDKLGMEFTPQCEFVNVVMNQEYLGSYYLCEQVRVGNSRVDIDDLEESEETKKAVDEKTISGGYLLSMCPYGDETGQVISTERGNTYLIESPSFEDYLNEAQLNYITNYMQKTENAIYGKDFKDESGKSYEDYMDINSAIDYYWIQEISMNGDAFGSTSTYLYKKRDGKLYWGPLWDFDFVAWGATEYSGNQCTGFTKNYATWFGRLFEDPAFYQKVVERWPAIREKLLEACRDGGQIDQYSQKQYASQKYNYEIWKQYNESYGNGWWLGEPDSGETVEITYDSEVVRLKKWIKERVEWIDGNLDSLKKEFCTVTFKIDDVEFTSLQVEKNYYIGELPVAPAKEGYVFRGWYVTGTQDGKEYEYLLQRDTAITENVTAVARWEERSKVSEIKQIGFARQEYYIFQLDEIELGYCVLPFDAYEEGLTWTSSDETIATVADGRVYTSFNKGDVVITATAPNGAKGSCVVHVCDYESYAELQSVKIAEKTITIKEGEYAKIPIVLNPSNAILYRNISYASSDEAVVKVNDCGYVYGVSKGTATIAAYGFDGGLSLCTVTVTGSNNTEPAPAENVVKKGSTFTVNGLKYKVLSVSGTKKVECIGPKNKKLTSLVIPATVTYQKKTYQVTAVSGFEGCTKLTKVVLGKNVAKLGDKTFYGCKKLKKIVIQSKKLKSVKESAVEGTSQKLEIVREIQK